MKIIYKFNLFNQVFKTKRNGYSHAFYHKYQLRLKKHAIQNEIRKRVAK